MKPTLLILTFLYAWILNTGSATAQCNAEFTWEQIPNTLQIHFNSTSTSEFDIVSYSWNFGDGHNGDGNDPYHTYDEPGVYVVCLIIEDAEGCESDVCHEVTVEAVSSECNANFEWEQVGSSYQVHFFNTSTSEFDIVSFQWNFGDGHTGDGENPFHTYDEPGVYVVCLIIEDAEGCVSDVCHEVTVESVSSECNANFEWEQVGNSYQIHFFNTSTSEFDIISFQWNFGDGHNGDGENPFHTYDESGVYVVCLIIEDAEGCVSDVCHEVTVEGVNSECNAQFTWEQFQGTFEVDFNSTSTSDHEIISYEWIWGDGFFGEGPSPSHTYDEPGVYVVCLIIENEAGCVDDVCHEVHVEGVSSECNAAFEWEQVGDSYQVHFFNNSTSEHDIVSYQWNFGDGHFGDGENPFHTYDEPGVYVVCLTIEDEFGCVDDVCHEVHVEDTGGEPCHAQFVWEQVENSLEIHFQSTSTSEFDIVSYQWNFGDGHSGDGPNPHHTYDEPGGYLVCLIITDADGCVSDVCHEVQVEEPGGGPCHAQFVWEQVENSLEIHFQSTSTSEFDIVSYQWNFGDGHSGDGPNPHHTYDEPGVYVVCLIITDAHGCVSDVCHEVHVEEPGGGPCHAQFVWEQVENSLEIHFHSTSTSEFDIVSYQWNFGDGHTGDGPNPHHTYDSPGVYVVCLIITDAHGCVSDVCHEIHVEGEGGNGPCHAQFVWEQVENSLEVHFQSTSTSEFDIVWYHWNFGDGHDGDGPNPHHTYGEPGEYLVCLTILDADSCISEVCHEIHVEEEGEGPCHAQFVWEQVENSLHVHFQSTSTSEFDIVSYHWIFGDGFEGDGPNPIHIYDAPGVYVVCLIIHDAEGCVSDVCHEVHVESPGGECEAHFNFEINNEGVVFFNNNSSGATDHTTWLWDFGDGQTSTAENPQHEYFEPGLYTVCLIMTDSTTNCSDDFCLPIVYGVSQDAYHLEESVAFRVEEEDNHEVGGFIFHYTNPVSSELQVDYTLPQSSLVYFEIYDLTGYRRLITPLAEQPAGKQQEVISLLNLTPGIYIMSISVSGDKQARLISIIR